LRFKHKNGGNVKRSPRLRELGQRIVTLREKRKWSQVELAERIAVPRTRLGKWERGVNGPPLEAVIELSKALGVTTDELSTGLSQSAVEIPVLSPEQQAEVVFHMKALGRLLKPLVKPDERVSGANSGRRKNAGKGGSR
jgi:transcriptional regulator with XRE-family HTH domain